MDVDVATSPPMGRLREGTLALGPCTLAALQRDMLNLGELLPRDPHGMTLHASRVAQPRGLLPWDPLSMTLHAWPVKY